MSNLVRIERQDCFTDTWTIAQNISYEHKDIVSHIHKHKKRFLSLGNCYVHSVKITQGQGRPANVYSLNEAQAIFLISLMDNSELVLDFKQALSAEFVRMRSLLLERRTTDWQEARRISKLVRLQETDAIKDLTDYARQQGSQNADKLYMNYAKLIKSIFGYNSRDTASTEVLNAIATFEHLLKGIIITEMQQSTEYHAIYQRAKKQLNDLKQLWYPAQHTLERS